MVKREKDFIGRSTDFFENIGVSIVGFTIKIASKRCFRVGDKSWKIIAAFINNQKGFIVTDGLGQETDKKQDEKQAEAVKAFSVVPETSPATQS
jgi:hypothetical protein